MNSTVNTYSKPFASEKYSSEFFSKVTFRTACQIVLPTLAPDGSLAAWTFSDAVPTEPLAIIVEAEEVILGLHDLQPILRQLEAAYKDGSRSIVASVTSGGTVAHQIYHFSKVCFASNVRTTCLTKNHLRSD
jgi:hypothetical protein